MRKTYLQQTHTKKHFLRWMIYGLLIFMFICLIAAYILYYQINQAKTAGFSDVKKQVLSETEIVEIDSIERFHGDDAYYIVYGKTSDDDKKIAFVPFVESEEVLQIIDQTDIISKDDMISNWRKNCDNCQLTKVVPGIVDDELIWEITYRDQSKRFVFEYVSIYDGTSHEKFRFTQLFK